VSEGRRKGERNERSPSTVTREKTMSTQVESIEVISVDTQRNGVSGLPFGMVIFTLTDQNGKQRRMLGVSFSHNDDEGTDMEGACGVIDLDLAYQGDLRVGWRGDHFESYINDAIRSYVNAPTRQRDRMCTPVSPASIELYGPLQAKRLAQLQEEVDEMTLLVDRAKKYLFRLICDEPDFSDIERIIEQIPAPPDDSTPYPERVETRWVQMTAIMKELHPRLEAKLHLPMSIAAYGIISNVRMYATDTEGAQNDDA